MVKHLTVRHGVCFGNQSQRGSNPRDKARHLWNWLKEASMNSADYNKSAEQKQTDDCSLGRSFQKLVLSLLVVAATTLIAGTQAEAGYYLNSAEPMCNGSDSTVLMCDDFEDGSWYTTNGDISGGKNNTANDGWSGTIYADPITPAGAAVCGNQGAVGSNCSATSGYLDGSEGGQNFGDHDLGPNLSSYNEIFWRYYIRTSNDTVWSGEKMLTFNKCCAGVGGIYFGSTGAGVSGAGANNTAEFNVCPVYDCFDSQKGFGGWRTQNQGSKLGVAANNHWYYVEIHVKLNSPGQANGIYEVWIDDCGIGLGCTGPGTLRTRYTDVQWVGPGDNSLIGSLWLENWGNNRPGASSVKAGTIGTHYYDQIVVATRRIGPMGVKVDMTPPGIVTGVSIQ
jgi:hypothetical protein